MRQYSVHSLAAALKAYFRQLPTPLIPPSTYGLLAATFGTRRWLARSRNPGVEHNDDNDRAQYIRRNVLGEMTTQRRALLALVIGLLYKTAQHADVNRMQPKNLAAVWTPNLIRCESIQDEMRMLPVSQKFIEILIELADLLFGEEADGESEDSSGD